MPSSKRVIVGVLIFLGSIVFSEAVESPRHLEAPFQISRQELEDFKMKFSFSGDRHFSDRLQLFCERVRSPSQFEKFVCQNREHPSFYSHFSARFRFKDQAGVERRLTWEHLPAMQTCSFGYLGHLKCHSAGQTQEEWDRWLNRESVDAAFRIARGQEDASWSKIQIVDMNREIPQSDALISLGSQVHVIRVE